MDKFLWAHARCSDGETLAAECIERLGPVPPEANLGFIYATDVLAGRLSAVVERLRSAMPGVHWVGSLGQGICVSGEEIDEEPALAVMVGTFPEGSFRLLPSMETKFEEAPTEVHQWIEERPFVFGLLHGDPENQRTPAIIEQAAGAAPVAFINGGITSSNLSNYQVLDAVVSGGVSGVLFDEQVAVATDHTQGCTPLGEAHRITGAERNVLATLDERPALEVMKEEIGEVLAKDLRRIAGYVFAGLPIEGSDTGDYLVRPLMGLDTRNGLVAVGDYLEGRERLMFCRRDGNSAREDMERMLGRLEKRVGGRSILGGVYVSCLGRGRHQFGENSEELKMISRTLGEFPLVGFFANGEIYNGRLYGYTGVLTLFLG